MRINNVYLDALKNRVKIGGMVTPNDQLMLIKDLLIRVTELEEMYEEIAKARTGNRKASKTKTSSD
jgi:hypothetical protein